METAWNRKVVFWGDPTEGYTRIEFRPERRTGADASDVQFTFYKLLHGTATVHKHFSLYTSNAAGTPTKRFNWDYGADVADFDIENTQVIIQNPGTGKIPLRIDSTTVGTTSLSQTPSDYSTFVSAVQSNTFKGIIGIGEDPAAGNVNSGIGVYDDGTGGAQGWWLATGNNTTRTVALRIDSAQRTRFSGAVVPHSSDLVALGSSSLMWADLFLASGGVINFNNGNATLTHSSGLLTSSVDIVVPDEVYGSGWNGSLEVPTKNAVYDKIESLVIGVVPGMWSAPALPPIMH